MEQVNLVPGPDQRALFVGQNGKGKTVGAVTLLMPVIGKRPVYVMDTKGDDIFSRLVSHFGDNAVLHTRFQDVANERNTPLVVYRPDGKELGDLNFLDRVCQWFYDRRGCVVYIDEVSQVTGGMTQPKPGFLNLYTRGRSHGVGVWASSQRPAYVPKIVYTEAQKYYVFFLADKDDRERVAKFTHPSLNAQPSKDYGFLFYTPKLDRAIEFGPMKLPAKGVA